jgi:DNA invertase Pin-like site-specific DNA recombinase
MCGNPFFDVLIQKDAECFSLGCLSPSKPDALQALNLERVFEDKASGRNADRPGLQQMLDFLREGDTLYVESISRIARSTRDLLAIIERLEARGVHFVSLKENIDTSTPQGTFILTVFAALAQLERESIHQRQREGIEAAKARGRVTGRPKVQCPTEWDRVYAEWKAGRTTAADAMRTLSLKRTSFYKLVRQQEASTHERAAS